MSNTRAADGVSVGRLILVPSLITLAVTLLRLVGELNHWSTTLFNPAAGGGASPVGIVWLVFVFGAYFGWTLARTGHGPASGGKVALFALAGVLLVVAAGVITGVVLKLGQNVVFLAIMIAAVAALALPYRAWPELTKTLIAYGLAARIPVALVMLAAILGNWGTHYDVAPPDFPETAPLPKFIQIGLLPQILLWVPFTVLLGAICGGIAAIFASRSAAVPARA